MLTEKCGRHCCSYIHCGGCHDVGDRCQGVPLRPDMFPSPPRTRIERLLDAIQGRLSWRYWRRERH